MTLLSVSIGVCSRGGMHRFGWQRVDSSRAVRHPHSMSTAFPRAHSISRQLSHDLVNLLGATPSTFLKAPNTRGNDHRFLPQAFKEVKKLLAKSSGKK